MNDSRFPGLHRLGVFARIAVLEERGVLSKADAELLRQGRHVIGPETANHMIENVIGTFALPFAIAPNLVVNGRDLLAPMVVEEPSIVAGTSFAALLSRATGGVSSVCRESLLAGQVHITGIEDIEAALAALNRASKDLIAAGNEVHPRLVQRGGGVREIETHVLELPRSGAVLGVHLLVDTVDAMGANLVNSICEAVAPMLAGLCGGKVALRILSNLADRSLVTARVGFAASQLATGKFAGTAVRDAIALASEIAIADPYRATTHNKGVLNGIDAVALATGNDWRAIEAAAHAYAASSGHYRPLATWAVDDNGDLAGELRMPIKVGIVGATQEVNAAARLGLQIAGVASARELAELMAAVGLLQNFAALRSLVTSGIQAGHMKLHARSVARAAGVPDELHRELVNELVASGDIKTWKARELVAAREKPALSPDAGAAGKVILLGEHAVVYGRHAVALPIPGAVAAEVVKVDSNPRIVVPEWGLDVPVTAEEATGVGAAVMLLMRELGVQGHSYSIRVRSRLPRAMGLGSSAAFAVAITRAFNRALDLRLDDERINDIAFECEKLAHGQPSGIDNSIATFGEAMLFRRGESLELRRLQPGAPPPLVVACSHAGGLTREQVAGVRERRAAGTPHYEAIFDEIDALSVEGADALETADYDRLGRLMNLCHGLLNAIEVSTPELEAMVGLTRAAGAVGAKLTGAGGGGSIVALCPGRVEEVRGALLAAGFKTVNV